MINPKVLSFRILQLSFLKHLSKSHLVTVFYWSRSNQPHRLIQITKSLRPKYRKDRKSRGGMKRRVNRGANAGYANIFARFQLSPALKAIIKRDRCFRCFAVTRLWRYIKSRGLQCKKDRRKILVRTRKMRALVGPGISEIDHRQVMVVIERNLIRL